MRGGRGIVARAGGRGLVRGWLWVVRRCPGCARSSGGVIAFVALRAMRRGIGSFGWIVVLWRLRRCLVVAVV